MLEEKPEEAEQSLIEMYKDAEALDLNIRMLWRFGAMRERRDLIDRARTDYIEGRCYSTVLVLLAVMDGFVNDLDPARRRGLHTRTPDEMQAWDSVVGHHQGLTNAHETFTRTFKRVSNEPVHELYRNGIVHGVLVNFDNDVVATKAWNRLFAVADWAKSLERAEVPAEPRPRWRDLFRQIDENARTKKALGSWTPHTVESGDPEFITDPVFAATVEYLDAWSARNYGAMAHLVASILAEDTHGQTAGMLRDGYDHLALSSYSVGTLDFTAPAVCEVAIRVVINGDERAARVRWIRERSDGSPATPSQEGEWRLAPWQPNVILRPHDDDSHAERPEDPPT
jgi:hypothetical protein